MNPKVFAVTSIGVTSIALLVLFGPDIHQYFGKRYSDADREIHQTSLSYVRGTVKNLQRFKLAYDRAETEQHKKIIAETVLTEVSTIDEEQLPPHLKTWVQALRNEGKNY